MVLTSDCNAGLEPHRAEVRVDTVRLSYLEWDGGPNTAVLLHGITSSAHAWWRVAPSLAARGYRVFAFDMPGHGHSDETEDHRIDPLADLIGQAIATLSLEQVTLVGHSWGGATALALASTGQQRRRLARVVLVDPAMRLSPETGATRLPDALAGLGEPAETSRPALRIANPAWHDCDIFWKGESLAQCRPGAVRGFYTSSGTWDLAERLAQVDLPLLLLVCDRAFTVIPADILDTAGQLLRPGLGQLVYVPGTDHSLFRGGFAPTIAALTAWLVRT